MPFAPELQEVLLQVKASPSAHQVVAIGNWPGVKPVNMSLSADGRTWQVKVKVTPGVYQYRVTVDDVPVSDSPLSFFVTPAEYSRRPAVIGDGKITLSGIAHRQADDLTRANERTVMVTLRVRRGDLDAASIAVQQGEEQRSYPLALDHEDPLYGYFKGRFVVTPGKPFSYRFILDDGAGARAYTSAGLATGLFGGEPFRVLSIDQLKAAEPKPGVPVQGH